LPAPASNLEKPITSEPHSQPSVWRDRLKHWYFVAAIGLLNAALLLLVLNLVLFLMMRERHPAETPVQEGHFDRGKLQQAYPGWREDDVKALIRETPRADREFEYEPLTGFRERPFRGRFVNIDPAGFRYVKNQAPWPPRPGVLNVFVFGGSTTFGWYLPDDETIPSYLQELAAQKDASIKVAIYNFARPAYISSQELALFQKLLRDGYIPQVAIFVDGLNDFILADGEPKFTDQMRRFMNGDINSNPLNNIPMVRAAHWLTNRWSKPSASARPLLASDYSDPVLLQETVERWLANKKMIELTAAGYGVRPIFVWQPIPVYKYDLRYHFFLHSYKDFGGYVRPRYGYPMMEAERAQGRLGDDVLWLADVQEDKHENLYVDSVHYTAAFSREIAERIADYLFPPSAQHEGQPNAATAQH
jgi:hypothetical protein